MAPRSKARFAGAVSALLLGIPRLARAGGDLAYGYEDYRESGGRIDVRTSQALAEQDLDADTAFKLGGTIDTITGATPTGEPAPAGSAQVPLSTLTDIRRAWDTQLSRQMGDFNAAAGFARSLEHDYVSDGWSLNTQTAFNRKNTTLLLGASGTDDAVEVFFKPEWLQKNTRDFIAGLTQLIDPLTSVTLDLTWSHAWGYLSEPYKLVEQDIQVIPGVYLPETFAENRPGWRDKEAVYASVNHAFPGAHAALEASYRFYADTFGIRAGTLEAGWIQHLGQRVMLEPSLRFYTQTAARFYDYDLAGTGVIPTRNPGPAGPFYSSDARISAFDAYTGGLKLTWTPADWLQLTIAFQGYQQHGTDGVTPQSAYYRAAITTAGAKIIW